MAVYEFKREGDGRHVTREFPIGTCPREITDEDGVIARRVFTTPAIKWAAGQESEWEKIRRKEAAIRDNRAAGDRGRDEWKERMPKLRLE